MPEEQNWGYVVLLNSAGDWRSARKYQSFWRAAFCRKSIPSCTNSLCLTPAELQTSRLFRAGAPRSQMLAFLADLAGGLSLRVSAAQTIALTCSQKTRSCCCRGKNLFRDRKEPREPRVFFSGTGGGMDAGLNMGTIRFLCRANSPCGRNAAVACCVLCCDDAAPWLADMDCLEI